MGRKPKEQLQVDEMPHGGNGHTANVTLESLAQSMSDLSGIVKSLQQQMQPEDEFAPDDSDLREEAAATAQAITSGEAGVNISTLGKSDRKGKASEMLVDAMFKDSKLDDMTDISSNLEAAAFAGVRTLNQFVQGAFTRKPGDKPVMISDLYLDNLFHMKRSIGGLHMSRAMAMSSVERDKEESRDNSIVFGGGGSSED